MSFRLLSKTRTLTSKAAISGLLCSSIARRNIITKSTGNPSITISVNQQHTAAAPARHLAPEAPLSVSSFPEFELKGKPVIVTGGGQGLGFENAKRLVQTGAHVHVLDQKSEPTPEFGEIQERAGSAAAGSLHYHSIELSLKNTAPVEALVAEIAKKYGGLYGLVHAAAIQHVEPILEVSPEVITRMMDVNIGTAWLMLRACAKVMIEYKTPGSLVLIASMSGFIANKDLYCAMYNASKAADIQLTRSAAMEFAQVIVLPDGVYGIRVNCICPGNIVTPMVLKNFEDDPSRKAKWEAGNMMGRLSQPHEYNGIVIYLLSDASSFQTGSAVIVDGGYTAW